ncbi:MAG: hypothetical protein P8X57_16215 [Cyclobacteriaceae bacterium]
MINIGIRYQERIELTSLDKFSRLWEFYKKGKTDELTRLADELKPKYPFISEAVRAHRERIPSESSPGRPVTVLQDIIRELGSSEFGPVFREFSKREYIYGYGDLQVKRLLDEATNQLK